MLGAFSGFYTAKATSSLDAGPRFLLVLAVAMVACAVAGLTIERLAYRPLRAQPRLNSLITAIGVSMFIQAVGQLPWFMGPSPQFFASVIPNRALSLGGDVSVTTLQVVTFGSALALMAGLHRLVFHTRMGTAMRAVSFDGRIAALMGINPDRVIAFTFILGSSLAAAAGVLIGMGTGRIEPTMGVMLGLKAFVAAVVGGIGNIKGAMVGGLTIGMTEALVSGYGGSGFRDAVVFSILIGILVFRPAGIFGRVAAEKV
jgi:branched-chain amino acid transport system permease protein